MDYAVTFIAGIDIWHFTSLASTFLIWLFLPFIFERAKWLGVIWLLLIQVTLFGSFALSPGVHTSIYFAQGMGAAQAVILIALMPFVVQYLDYWVPIALLFLGLLDAVYLLAGGGGMLTGSSFDTAMLAVLVPVALYALVPKYRYWVALVFLAAIVRVGGSTAYLILTGELIVHVVQRKKLLEILGLIPAVGGIVGIAFLTHGSEIWNDNNRLDMWRTYLELYTRLSTWGKAVGEGLGSFEWIGTLIKVNGQNYVWMHNDWLQILFETGYIGLFIAVCLFVWKLKGRRDRMVVVGFAICMCFYSPLRFVYGQVIAVWLLMRGRYELPEF